MWSFITSFFGNNHSSDDLTLENACSLLETSVLSPAPILSEDTHRTVVVTDNAFVSKTGEITEILNNTFVIDNSNICDKTLLSNLEVGAKVSYHTLISNGQERILKVSLIDNEWDICENKNELWNNRVVVCKVERREGRKLYLSPGDIEVDLNSISVEFLPVIGDWLELDAKCTINENSVNLLGDLIEINKISPVRPHVIYGTINKWNSDEGSGIINNNVFFFKSSLNNGYNPFVGDKVIVQVIESEQNRCCWRAVQVLPECLKNKTPNALLESISKDYITEYPGIVISGLDLYFERLNTTKYFCITIYNNLEKNITLRKVEILNSNSQCKIPESINNIIITIRSEYKINCQSMAKNIGMSKDFLLLTFDECTIGKWINIDVSLKNNQTKNSHRNYQYNAKPRLQNDFSHKHVIRGQGFSNTRFQSVQMPTYDVPQKLLSFICQYDYSKDITVITEELKIIKPVLFSSLSITNYEDKFHTLLHLDEISNLIAVRIYDQDKTCFIPNNEFLMLEIENLSECRPSLILGDKIIATNSINDQGMAYEGIVHKVGANHVYLKFSPLFHDQYKGEDYSFRVVPQRQLYRKLHHAIYLAVRSLGGDILFPSRLITKDPQLKFDFDCMNKNIDEYQAASHENGLQLEWYNKKVNVSQQNAVINILRGSARPLPYIIFGPPGTGKTVTLIEIILQITRSLPQSRYDKHFKFNSHNLVYTLF